MKVELDVTEMELRAISMGLKLLIDDFSRLTEEDFSSTNVNKIKTLKGLFDGWFEEEYHIKL